MSFLKLQLIGNLGNDAIVNDVNGKKVINANVAVSEKWKDAQNNPKEKTTWVSISYWTDKTGLIPYLTKGCLVYIEGKPESKIYTNKEGVAIPQLHLTVASLQLLSSNKTQQVEKQVSDDDNFPLPF